MEFCPKCGSLLVPENQDGRRVLICKKCGSTKDAADSRERYVLSKEMPEKDNVVVIREEVVPYPKTKATCSKCGNTEAYYYSVQTRGGDESETVYMTCTKCKHVWKVTS
jgi:DNA-directed RNA polymerase subunit M